MQSEPAQFVRSDVSFSTRDGTRLSGWLFDPGRGQAPAIVMTHGFTALIDQGLAYFAERLAAAGFVVLAYDHRGYGRSEGLPRSETNPFQQLYDMKDAVTYLSLLPMVDERRIGVWGASYAGGHALMMGATDRRIKCVVAVVPSTSGSETVKRLTGEGNLEARHERMFAARKAEATGQVQYQTYTTVPESLEWFQSADQEGRWRNEVTVLSLDMVADYEPGDYIHRIAPTPLLMIVADHDRRCPTDLQLAAYERAREPKRIIVLKGGHYEAYTTHRETVAAQCVGWFAMQLAAGPGSSCLAP